MRKLMNRIASIMVLPAASLMLATNAKGDTPDFALSGGDELIPLYEDTVLVFRQSGTLHVTGSGYVEILAVGGGGGGGSLGTHNYSSGGGGAGGVVHQSGQFVTAGDYPIVIGAGGNAGAADQPGENGGTTTALGFSAFGGGGGAKADSSKKGNDGASGGGAAMWYNGTPSDVGGAAIYSEFSNMGFAGGGTTSHFRAGGGGGAGEPGETPTAESALPGRGGNGYCCSIVGTNVWYGGGGAGFRNGRDVSGGLGGGGSCVMVDSSTSTPGAGEDGFGGGGSGGARGGDGVVIIRYHKVSYKTAFNGATGGTVSSRNKHRIHTFADDGTFTMPEDGLVEVLLVGGGGGGGGCLIGQYEGYQGGAGGGAGGVVHITNLVLRAGSYPISIGSGGGIDENGGNTTAFDRIAYGGGAGARYDGRGSPYVTTSNYGKIGSSGGSGGGSTHARDTADVTVDGLPVEGGTAIYGEEGNLGHDGGISLKAYAASGGGGAGGVGGSSNGSLPGVGGIGYQCDISGTMEYYAGGGAGFRNKQQINGGLGGGGSCVKDGGTNTSTPEAGSDGLGGGGCGGARGGSGVVIIRYQTIPNGLTVSFR